MAFTSTDIWIIFYCIGLLLCWLIFIGEILGLLYNASRLNAENRQSYTSKQNLTNLILYPLFLTYILSIGGVSSAINRLYNANKSLCNYTYALTWALYVSIKITNYFFFLQRAKLAQGLNPILKEKTFKKKLPFILLIYWLILMILISIFRLNGTKKISPNNRHLCIWSKPNLLQRIGIIFESAFNISWTIFFLYLFGKPMLDVQKRNNYTSSSPKLPYYYIFYIYDIYDIYMIYSVRDLTDRKLKRTVLINFVF